MEYQWNSPLTSDDVWSVVIALEAVAQWEGDNAEGRHLTELAERLRNDYACHLEKYADAVRNGRGVWTKRKKGV